ncbi:MAG: PDDEXK nuclease domain-containing protein [Rhodomicrobium sp.]
MPLWASQYHLEVGGQDYFLDLLFYHLRLRCFVIFELKIEEFKPEFAGKMNFYLSALDEQLKHADDQPSIGVILCKGRNSVIVEYALRDTSKPMGVAAYRLTPAPALPRKLKRELPTSEELAGEFPLFSMVSLRIEIEHALRELMDRRAIPLPDHSGIAAMMRALQKFNLLPATQELTDAMRVMNGAAHGQMTDPAARKRRLQTRKNSSQISKSCSTRDEVESRGSTSRR